MWRQNHCTGSTFAAFWSPYQPPVHSVAQGSKPQMPQPKHLNCFIYPGLSRLTQGVLTYLRLHDLAQPIQPRGSLMNLSTSIAWEFELHGALQITNLIRSHLVPSVLLWTMSSLAVLRYCLYCSFIVFFWFLHCISLFLSLTLCSSQPQELSSVNHISKLFLLPFIMVCFRMMWRWLVLWDGMNYVSYNESSFSEAVLASW